MISAVINTLNEEKNIERCLKSLDWVDEIVICDDGSNDKTLDLAKKFTGKIYHHKSEGYVEAARNFAIGKAKGDWILIVDADEEIPKNLAQKLVQVTKKQCDFVWIPRKNIIFDRWIKHSGWWPDYNVRFFKKDKVKWSGKIHEDPKTKGSEYRLLPREDLAIIHYNYSSISQYLKRLDRYTDIESDELIKEGYKFNWQDLISKPVGEFLSRFFAREGYKDGLHGLVLAVLQAISFFIAYAKIWEKEGFQEEEIQVEELKKEIQQKGKETGFWFLKTITESEKGFKKLVHKITRRVSR